MTHKKEAPAPMDTGTGAGIESQGAINSPSIVPDQQAAGNSADAAKADAAQAVEFLRSWPSAFVHLVAIHVDPTTGEKGRIESRSFTGGDLDNGEIERWLRERDGRANLYFTVNSLITLIDKKATKRDVREMVALHLDVDLPEGVAQDGGIAALLDRVGRFKHEPSLVVDSGGGIQLFWILQKDARVTIDGDEAKWTVAEAYNKAVEAEAATIFEGVGKVDHCHNVDRIMRLPGSVNCPDEKKREKGRVARVARLAATSNKLYAPSDFGAAVSPQAVAVASGKPQRTSEVGPPVEDLDVDPRTKDLSPWCKAVIRNGRAPQDDQGKDCSGSGWLIRLCVKLAQACVPEEDIRAVIFDPRYKISEAALKNKKREGNRAITKALDAAVDGDLAKLNENHCVLQINGKVRVLRRTPSTVHPGSVENVFFSFDDFRNLLSNRSKEWIGADGKAKSMPLAQYWLGHPRRREYLGGMRFMPERDEDAVGDTLNLWTGFTVEPRKGDCSKYLAHIRDVICSGNQPHYDYQIKWMAFIVQNPGRRTEVACVWRSDAEGSGKNYAEKKFGRLFGPHYMRLTDPDHLVGKFNPHLETLLLVNADEALFAGNPNHRNALYGLITGDTLTVEPKGINKYTVPSHLNLIITSNSRHVVPAGFNARRFFVLDVSPCHVKDFEWFDAIDEELDNGGYEALLYHLKHEVDLSGFNVHDVPKTAALDAQRAETRKGIDALIEAMCDDGVVPHAVNGYWANVAETTGERNGTGFWAHVRDAHPELRHRSPHAMSSELRKDWECKGWHQGARRGLAFPPLPRLRELFSARHGEQDWACADVTEWNAPAAASRTADDDRQDDIPF